MGYVRLSGDAIWAISVEGDNALKDRILALASGDTIELEIDGIVGAWEKMKTGRDGRATNAIRPVGPMRDIWRSMQSRKGEFLEVRAPRPMDPYTACMWSSLAEEWNSPEDEEAFRDLPLW